MYATCLFCHEALGANEVIEHFPVGRRLAYDASKGRLWVVCVKCGRWNLSPIEERWEAIEAAERIYRDTKKRVATDNIGLARLRDGTDLIRIGAPLRPEYAAWRYGDTFGRRRRKHLLMGAAAVAGGWGIIAGANALAIGGMVAPIVYPLWTAFRVGSALTEVPYGARGTIRVTRDHLPTIRVSLTGDEQLRMQFVHFDRTRHDPMLPFRGLAGRALRGTLTTIYLTGTTAEHALMQLLSKWNGAAGSASNVSRAVEVIERFPSMAQLVAAAPDLPARTAFGLPIGPSRKLPATFRLALEMSLHEEAERRALEGELAELEQRWKEAEEIAAIADNLTLNAEALQRLERLQQAHKTVADPERDSF